MERLIRKRRGMRETFRSVDTVEKEVKEPHTFSPNVLGITHARAILKSEELREVTVKIKMTF